MTAMRTVGSSALRATAARRSEESASLVLLAPGLIACRLGQSSGLLSQRRSVSLSASQSAAGRQTSSLREMSSDSSAGSVQIQLATLVSAQLVSASARTRGHVCGGTLLGRRTSLLPESASSSSASSLSSATGNAVNRLFERSSCVSCAIEAIAGGNGGAPRSLTAAVHSMTRPNRTAPCTATRNSHHTSLAKMTF